MMEATTSSAQSDHTRSESPDRLSIKSDSSMMEPLKFTEGETNRPEDPEDSSMFEQVAFADERTRSDFMFKLVLVGDSAVGKTALLVRFADHEYRQRYYPTIGVDYKKRTMKLDGKSVKLEIWDTAGHESYHSITSSYYRAADGIIVAYDVTKQHSFDSVERWLKDIERLASPDVNKLLVGNKCDLTATNREVDYTTAKEFADKLGIPFVETSAKSGANVAHVFKTMVAKIKRRMEPGAPVGPLGPNVNLQGSSVSRSRCF